MSQNIVNPFREVPPQKRRVGKMRSKFLNWKGLDLSTVVTGQSVDFENDKLAEAYAIFMTRRGYRCARRSIQKDPSIYRVYIMEKRDGQHNSHDVG